MQADDDLSLIEDQASSDSLLATPKQTRRKFDEDGASSRKPNSSLRSSLAAMSMTAQKDNVKVVIRVRPVNEREQAGGSKDKVKLCLVVERNEKITLDKGAETKTFTFDFVATQESEQAELFEKIAKPIADSCLEGYNGTIFAYGQTGSGKTFTIQGPTILVNGEETLIGASAANNQLFDKRGLM